MENGNSIMTKFYKECRYRTCFKFFEVELMSIQIYCEECKNKTVVSGITNQQNYIQNIKYSRSISLDCFDVYDLERPIKNHNNDKIIGYERVCRICGAPLRNKKGEYSDRKRYCGTKECNGGILFSKFNWKGCRFKYIKILYEKQEKEIESELLKRNIDIERKYHFIFCEKCNKLCKINNDWWAGDYLGALEFKEFESVEIHHKQPVYTLTEENILLIFDSNNLICLCESCHNKTKGIKKPKGQIKHFITLERFLYA